jgi:hypothetical protein
MKGKFKHKSIQTLNGVKAPMQPVRTFLLKHIEGNKTEKVISLQYLTFKKK